MSILIDKSTRLLVQGITGRDGHFHAVKMKEYGTNVVGGTSPGKGGSTVDGLPVFNTMYEAVEKTQANASILFVPASYAADAIMEAADAGIKLIICISEGIPTRCNQSVSLHSTERSHADRAELPRFNFSGKEPGRNLTRQRF